MDEPIRSAFEAVHASELSRQRTKLGISKERARQIEHQAMEKLKTMGTSMGLEDFLE